MDPRHGSNPGADQGIRPELVDAYTLAVALAPAECHLSLSLLAAIGQVESGNLAGQRINAGHRVVPGVLGPVLDGSKYAEIPDTDDGRWDGNKTWDRALGPLQLLPASWRMAGMDSDGDGRRDPQNVYDAAGAAMVYLCDGGRDLGTRKGLEEAVLAYNHSRAYLKLVLAWKTVFDTADVTGLGSTPPLGAWACVDRSSPPADQDSCPPRRHRRPARASPRSRAAAVGARPPTVTPTAHRDADRERRSAADPTAGPTAVPTASDPPAPSAKPTRSPTSPATSRSPATSPEARRQAQRHALADLPDGRADTDRRPQCRTHLLPGRTGEPTATPTPTPRRTRARSLGVPDPAPPRPRPRRRRRLPERRRGFETGSFLALLNHRGFGQGGGAVSSSSNCARFMAKTNRRPGYSVSDQSMSVEGQ